MGKTDETPEQTAGGAPVERIAGVPVSTDARLVPTKSEAGRDMVQLIPTRPELSDETIHYSIGDREFQCRAVRTYIEPDHFQEIKIGGKPTFRLDLDAKLKIMAMANVSRVKSRFLKVSATECEYEAVGEWLSPTGQLHTIARRRRINIDEEEERQILEKVKYKLRDMKNNTRAAAAYEGTQKALQRRMSEQGMSLSEAMLDMAPMIVPLEDLAQIATNRADMRAFLPALCQSKGESQLGTAIGRMLGARLVFERAPQDMICVTLLNTVEIPPKEITGQVIDVLYEETKADEDAVVAEAQQEVKQADDTARVRRPKPKPEPVPGATISEPTADELRASRADLCPMCRDQVIFAADVRTHHEVPSDEAGKTTTAPCLGIPHYYKVVDAKTGEEQSLIAQDPGTELPEVPEGSGLVEIDQEDFLRAYTQQTAQDGGGEDDTQDAQFREEPPPPPDPGEPKQTPAQGAGPTKSELLKGITQEVGRIGWSAQAFGKYLKQTYKDRDPEVKSVNDLSDTELADLYAGLQGTEKGAAV